MKIIVDKELFQWEIGRTVEIVLEEGDEDITSIEFYSDKSKNSQSVEYTGEKVEIPDKFLQNSRSLVVSACSNDGVVARKEFKVLFRKKPENYQGDSDEGEDKEIILDGGEEI